jgi:hypothetical protein
VEQFRQAGSAYPLERTKLTKQRFPACRTDTRHAVQLRGQPGFAAALAVVRQRESVGLITDALCEEKRWRALR